MTIDTSREAVERLLDGVTRGPWRVGPVDDCRVEDADGNEVSQIDGDYNHPDLWPIMEANARFIAAARDLVPALLAERDAALAEVARLSTPPDDAEVRAWALALDETARGHDDEYEGTGYAIYQRLADEAREVSGFLTRLSHALAAEAAKREAMEEALDDIAEGMGEDTIEDIGRFAPAVARATLAKHGSKT